MLRLIPRSADGLIAAAASEGGCGDWFMDVPRDHARPGEDADFSGVSDRAATVGDLK